MISFSTTTLVKIVTGAFPPEYRAVSCEAANVLFPFVDRDYRSTTIQAVVGGKIIEIPSRIHFMEMETFKGDVQGQVLNVIHCLLTRSTDGYKRQEALNAILATNDPWVVPFIVLLAGEYVVEIIHDMAEALPSLDRDTYINFVLENRPLMRLLRKRAESYWNCYYRREYPEKSTYPGLQFLHQLEIWVNE